MAFVITCVLKMVLKMSVLIPRGMKVPSSYVNSLVGFILFLKFRLVVELGSIMEKISATLQS